MRFVMGAAIPLLVLLGATEAIAQEAHGLVYGGIGQASDDDLETDALPWSAGFAVQARSSRFLFGFDIAGEGSKLDSTFGGDSLQQALSYNLLLGGNLMTNGKVRIDAGLLLGVRETFADCPDSYLGYQCYADTPPTIEYGANYGAMVGVSYSSMMLGVRATGESTQALIGFRF